MNKELVITTKGNEIVIAQLEDRRLTDLNREKSNNSFAVGDIYLGRIRKIMPGLNAAFVDVGYEKDAFLHYLDLGPQVKSLQKFMQLVASGKSNGSSLANFSNEDDIPKDGKIGTVLQQNGQMLVQIAKEPISTKGPRISSELSLAGRFLVLVPFSDKISVSQKIKENEEKNRLKRLIQSIRPPGFGVIIRTVAANKKVAELDQDLNELVQRWEQLVENLNAAQPKSKVLGEIKRTSALLRDILNDTYQSITVDDAGIYQEVKSYIAHIAPEKEKIVKLYKGKESIFEHFAIDRQIKAAFGQNVSLKSGAYLIIQHTEAMHVIDVNSGHRTRSDNDQETNALETNLEAAHEISRQLRLRDMGGIIVIDFIDMHSPNNRKILFDKLKECMSHDRAKHTILPPSKFGLIQLTRQRVRPELVIETLEKCPACNGTGEIQPSMLITDEIENNLRYLYKEQNQSGIQIWVSPMLEAFIKRGFPSMQMRWFMRYKSWIKVKAVSSFHVLEYHFLNKNEEEIKL
ncbi:MAG: Rne/Rng family ribonuclease [Bacteroidia bacterium]|jgi:ribonuclease G